MQGLQRERKRGDVADRRRRRRTGGTAEGERKPLLPEKQIQRRYRFLYRGIHLTDFHFRFVFCLK